MRRDKVRSALAFCTAGHRWCRAHNIEHKLEEFAGGQAYCSPEEATVKFQQLVDDPDAITDSVGEDTRARKRCWVNPQNRVTKRRICYPPQAGNGDAAATAAPAHQAVAQRERPSLGQGVLIDYARAGALRLQRSWMRRQVHAAQYLVEAETDLNQQCAKDPDIAEEVRHERKIFNRRVRLLKLVIALHRWCHAGGLVQVGLGQHERGDRGSCVQLLRVQ